MLLTARRITSLFGRIVPYIEKKRGGKEGEGGMEGRKGGKEGSIYSSKFLLLYSIGFYSFLFETILFYLSIYLSK